MRGIGHQQHAKQSASIRELINDSHLCAERARRNLRPARNLQGRPAIEENAHVAPGFEQYDVHRLHGQLDRLAGPRRLERDDRLTGFHDLALSCFCCPHDVPVLRRLDEVKAIAHGERADLVLELCHVRAAFTDLG